MRRPFEPKKARPLKPEERDLWRHYTRGVNPLRHDIAESPEPAPLTDRPKTKGALKSTTRPIAPPLPKTKARVTDQASLDGSTQRKLRRGRAEIDATIDLHGMRQAEAHSALISFVMGAKDRGHRCILVITGKGSKGERTSNPYESPGPGILRTRLRQWLAQDPLSGIVFGVEEAHPRHGGSGAFYVFIRRKG